MGAESDGKVCPKCAVLVPLSGYSKCSKAKSGLQHTCKACDRAYRVENSARESARAKIYCEKNKERIAARRRAFEARNKEELALRYRAYREKSKETPEYWARRTVCGARNRAKRNGQSFSLTVEWALEQIESCKWICPALGTQMLLASGHRDDSPSIDRIDPGGGYVQENCRIISWRANRLKGDGSPSELKRVAEYAMQAYRLSDDPAPHDGRPPNPINQRDEE